jgi:hypothetical protein
VLTWNKNLRQCPIIDDVLVSITNITDGNTFTWVGFRNNEDMFLMYAPTGLDELPDHWQIKAWMPLPEPIK